MRVHPLLKPLLRVPGSLAAAVLVSLLAGFLPSSPLAAEPPRFGILVQSDCRGELRPCRCPGKVINSLSRRSGVFGLARSLRYPVAILDGGDFIPGPEEELSSELRDLMFDAMGLMKYDAVALGELDLLPGREFLARVAGALPLVCGNLQLGPSLDLDVPAVRWVEAEGLRVAVTAYLDPLLFYTAPGAFDLYGEDLVLLDPVESLGEVLASVRSEADLVVLLAHAPLEEVDRVLSEVSGIDVVVQTHDPQAPATGMPHEGAILVVTEPRSRHVNQLTLRLPPGKPAEIQTARTWDLRQTRYEDGRLQELVREFENRYGTP